MCHLMCICSHLGGWPVDRMDGRLAGWLAGWLAGVARWGGVGWGVVGWGGVGWGGVASCPSFLFMRCRFGVHGISGTVARHVRAAVSCYMHCHHMAFMIFPQVLYIPLGLLARLPYGFSDLFASVHCMCLSFSDIGTPRFSIVRLAIPRAYSSSASGVCLYICMYVYVCVCLC